MREQSQQPPHYEDCQAGHEDPSGPDEHTISNLSHRIKTDAWQGWRDGDHLATDWDCRYRQDVPCHVSCTRRGDGQEHTI